MAIRFEDDEFDRLKDRVERELDRLDEKTRNVLSDLFDECFTKIEILERENNRLWQKRIW